MRILYAIVKAYFYGSKSTYNYLGYWYVLMLILGHVRAVCIINITLQFSSTNFKKLVHRRKNKSFEVKMYCSNFIRISAVKLADKKPVHE